MELKVRDVAELLDVSEKTVYAWIKEGGMPAYRIDEQFMFNRVEILEWATAHKIAVSSSVFGNDGSASISMTLSDALTSGGIVYDLQGVTKGEVLTNAVAAMQLPDKVDRDRLLQLLVARESLASTAIGDGIAIPHVRHPLVFHVSAPTITLCFLKNPVDFGALDGGPVFCIFMMVSPTVRAHLQLISRLAFVLKNPAMKKIIDTRGSREEIFAQLGRLEDGIGEQHGSQEHRK